MQISCLTHAFSWIVRRPIQRWANHCIILNHYFKSCRLAVASLLTIITHKMDVELINSRRQYSHFGPKYFLVLKLVLPVFNTYDPVISMIQKEKKDCIYANCIHKRNKMNALVSGAIGIGLIETILFFSITFYALKIIEWISWMVFIFAMYFSAEYFVAGNDRKISSSLLTIKFSVAMVRNRGVWLTQMCIHFISIYLYVYGESIYSLALWHRFQRHQRANIFA